MIRPASTADAAQIAAIYNHYIENTVITFEETPVDADEIAARMGDLSTGHPWFVDEIEGEVTGYAYAGEWSKRCAYRNSVETSIYLRHSATGRGTGTALYQHLLTELADRGIHTVVGGAALPNPASVALHEKLGFEKVAHFKEVGWKFGEWIDVGYWQKIL